MSKVMNWSKPAVRNDLVVSVWIPATTLASLAMELEERELTLEFRGGTSTLIRFWLEKAMETLHPGGRFDNATAAVEYLESKGYSMKQLYSPDRGSAIKIKLSQESTELEGIGSLASGGFHTAPTPEDIARHEEERKYNEEHADELREESVTVFLKGLRDGTINEARARVLLQEYNLTLEDAITEFGSKLDPPLTLAPPPKQITQEELKEQADASDPYPQDLGSNEAVDKAMEEEAQTQAGKRRPPNVQRIRRALDAKRRKDTEV